MESEKQRARLIETYEELNKIYLKLKHDQNDLQAINDSLQNAKEKQDNKLEELNGIISSMNDELAQKVDAFADIQQEHEYLIG